MRFFFSPHDEFLMSEMKTMNISTDNWVCLSQKLYDSWIFHSASKSTELSSGLKDCSQHRLSGGIIIISLSSLLTPSFAIFKVNTVFENNF